MKIPVVVLAVLLAVPLISQAPSPGQAAYARANKLFGAQKYQECMDALDEALRLDPKLVPALTLKAKLAMSVRRWDVARECLEKAIAAAPSSAYAHFLYGFQFYEQNEMPAAIQALEKARRLNPRDPRAALFLGLARESLGGTNEALALYEEAIRLEQAGGKPQASTLLALFRLQLVLGRLDAASKVVDQALRLEPGSRDPHFEAARLHLRKGDAEAAFREATRALELPAGDASDRQVRYLLVQACRASGREDEAERHAAAIRAIDAR